MRLWRLLLRPLLRLGGQLRLEWRRQLRGGDQKRCQLLHRGLLRPGVAVAAVVIRLVWRLRHQCCPLALYSNIASTQELVVGCTAHLVKAVHQSSMTPATDS